MYKWNQLVDKETINKTIEALKANGIEAKFVENGEEAKKLVFELIPVGSEIMTMSSTTLDTISLSEEINKKGSKFKPVRDKLYAMDRATQAQEMNRFQNLEKNLGEMLKVPVLIRSTDKGGHIVIKFATLQELNKVAKRIID